MNRIKNRFLSERITIPNQVHICWVGARKTVSYSSVGDESSNDCCIACRSVSSNASVNNATDHGLLCKTESLRCPLTPLKFCPNNPGHSTTKSLSIIAAHTLSDSVNYTQSRYNYIFTSKRKGIKVTGHRIRAIIQNQKHFRQNAIYDPLHYTIRGI
ncbi:hypothetical protein TNCV_42781 [Trichonephila clavipes]|nr:hypothetical protein TNCV_42781 [Trichonephila clavipes]